MTTVINQMKKLVREAAGGSTRRAVLTDTLAFLHNQLEFWVSNLPEDNMMMAAKQTMLDVEWDDEQHVGMWARHTGDNHLVIMLEEQLEEHGQDEILVWEPLSLNTMRYPVEELVPDPTLARVNFEPTARALSTLDDFEKAPSGTIIAEDDGGPWIKVTGGWMNIASEMIGDEKMVDAFNNPVVLRTGWEH